MKTETIIWQPIGIGDYKAWSPCKRYFLRVEDMDNFWWWSVSFEGKEIAASWDNVSPKTKDLAFKEAEAAYQKHANQFLEGNNTQKIKNHE